MAPQPQQPEWVARATPGAFRNVPFEVDDKENKGGRKVVVNEYPQRDTPFVEDMGRVGRALEVNCFVSGSDYITKRDYLRNALEAEGPATLTLPFEDDRVVQVLTYTDREDHERGIARFSISFYETARQPFAPGVSVSPREQLASSANLLATKNVNSLDAYRMLIAKPSTGVPIPGLTTTKSLPGFAFTSITGLLQQATHAIAAFIAPVTKGTQELASLKRQTEQIINTATSLVRDPLTLGAQFGFLLQNIAGLTKTPRLGVSSLMNAYNFSPAAGIIDGSTVLPPAPRPAATTPTHAIEQGNYDILDGFIRRGILVQAAQLAAAAADPNVIQAMRVAALATDPTSDPLPVDAGYQTYEEAVSARDEIVAAIDDQLAGADDDTYAALVQLRTDLAAAVPSDSNALPHLATFTPATTLPSLVIAYQLYGDVNRADDIVARNGVAHPGFVPGGRPLQVLTNA